MELTVQILLIVFLSIGIVLQIITLVALAKIQQTLKQFNKLKVLADIVSGIVSGFNNIFKGRNND